MQKKNGERKRLVNPVRAGLVSDPKVYRYCGYAESVAGNFVTSSVPGVDSFEAWVVIEKFILISIKH